MENLQVTEKEWIMAMNKSIEAGDTQIAIMNQLHAAKDEQMAALDRQFKAVKKLLSIQEERYMARKEAEQREKQEGNNEEDAKTQAVSVDDENAEGQRESV